MKNLNELGVQEMNMDETHDVDGGSYISIGLAYAGMIAAAATGAGLIVGAIAVGSVIVACYEHDGGELF